MLIAGILLQTVILLITGRILLPLVAAFMESHGLCERNYCGDTVPTACGLLFWLLLMVENVVAAVTGKLGGIDPDGFLSGDQSAWLAGYSLSLTAVAFIGFMDDAVGFKKIKGFSGHWRLWKERRIASTGLLKAAGTAAASVLFVLQLDSGSITQRGLQTLLLMLITNAFNLLDLRPGRAFKCFFMFSAAALAIAAFFPLRELDNGRAETAFQAVSLILPVFAGALVLFGSDLRGKMMMGDTGANMLGFASGCCLIISAAWAVQAVTLLLLILLHMLTRSVSLSSLIERNRLLQWFDLLGRRSRV